MTRKIVQLANSFSSSTMGEHDMWDNLYALCDDGSVWVKNFPADTSEHQQEWRRVKDVPQEPGF